MRLDLFLKKSRVVKTRAKSKTLCRKEMVLLNDVKAKSGKDVKPNDIIRIDFSKRILVIEVTKMPTGNVPKSEVTSYYNVIKDEKVNII